MITIIHEYIVPVSIYLIGAGSPFLFMWLFGFTVICKHEEKKLIAELNKQLKINNQLIK